MPEVLRVIFEDVYAQGISQSFFLLVPFAIVSLIAIAFLPNVPLTRMTNSELLETSEAHLATVSVAEGVEILAATAGFPTDADGSRRGEAARAASSPGSPR